MVPTVSAFAQLTQAFVLHDAPPILGLLVAAVVVSWASRRLVRWTRRRLESSSSATETISLQRRATITRAISSAIAAVVWSIAILLILVRLNVDIGAVLTTAGLAGLVIAFGAQNFVRDIADGVFVVFENQLTWVIGSSSTSGTNPWRAGCRPSASAAPSSSWMTERSPTWGTGRSVTRSTGPAVEAAPR
jgi:small-conductance mechanosensitive channel